MNQYFGEEKVCDLRVTSTELLVGNTTRVASSAATLTVSCFKGGYKATGCFKARLRAVALDSSTGRALNVCRTSDVYAVATGCEKPSRQVQRNIIELHPSPELFSPRTR